MNIIITTTTTTTITTTMTTTITTTMTTTKNFTIFKTIIFFIIAIFVIVFLNKNFLKIYNTVQENTKYNLVNFPKYIFLYVPIMFWLASKQILSS